MQLKFKYQQTEKIKQQLLELHILKLVFEMLPDLPHIEENIQRESLLKSALFSARVEGNPLNIQDLKTQNAKSIHKLEIFNLLSAYKSLSSHSKSISLKTILNLHSIVLKDLSNSCGQIRTENLAIFNQAGFAIYL